MTNLQIFDNEDFGSIRAIEINGEPWFVGKDAATALGYSDTADAIKRHVDSDDKLTRRFTDSGQSRDMCIINESGLYSLIFSSQLPKAKDFKRWITSEVLPSLRKTGTYSLKGYPKKSTSAGEVASLLKPIERVMLAQKTPPSERAATVKMVCEQFGVSLPENFVKQNPYAQMIIVGYIN